MHVQLRKPYKIARIREKQYDTHYKIPSKECVIIPIRTYGDQALCDIRWENENGELVVIHQKMFAVQNLLPLDQMLYDKLFEIWKHYYMEPSAHHNPGEVEPLPGQSKN